MYSDFEEDWLYPNYVRNPVCPLNIKHPKKEDMPYQLEHIYNLDTGEYKYNKSQCCYYTESEGCKHCTHPKQCIFKGDKWDVLDTGRLGEISREMKRINGLINTFRLIIDANWNGEIIYHEELEDLYIIDIERNGDKVDYSVNVVPNFRGRVNDRIRELQMVLRELSRERLRL